MEVVYFFCGSKVTRVPFYKWDKYLFNFLNTQGGVWNYDRHEFIFESDIDFEKFTQYGPGLICVKFNDYPKFLCIHGFWERPRKDVIIIDCKVKNEEAPVNMHTLERAFPNNVPGSGNDVVSGSDAVSLGDKFSLLGEISLPEKFPESWQKKLDNELRSRKYSPRTIRAYLYYNRLICRVLQKVPEQICREDITKFLAIIEKDKEYSASSMNLALSAIKFFYKEVLKKEFADQCRPRHDKRLPIVLSKTEIAEILRLERNPKHRLLLMLVYSSGLRVSEVVSLQKEHIDLSRKVIYIMQSKGRKDRYTLLSEKAAAFISEYYAFFDIHTWLFPGQNSSRHLTIRSAQQIFEKALHRADINKKISIHGLRHSFATHLLESGTDIRYIQTLLGHASLRTTQGYTHIAKRNILSIQSPLDTML